MVQYHIGQIQSVSGVSHTRSIVSRFLPSWGKKALLLFVLCSACGALSAQKNPVLPKKEFHTVATGETLYRISKMYGVEVAQLMAWNNLPDFNLQAGQNLRVAPPPTVAAVPPFADTVKAAPVAPALKVQALAKEKPFEAYEKQTGCVHVAAEGETMANLARLYGYTEERFREFNGMTNGQEIETGRAIRNTECGCPNRPLSEYPDGEAAPTPPEAEKPVVVEKTPAEIVVVAPPEPAPQAAETYQMTAEELSMIDEINLIRSNPPGYVPYVLEYIADMKKNGHFGNSIATAKSLIKVLKRTKPMPVLAPSECIYIVARAHGLECLSRGRTEHRGLDNSWPWDRITRNCKTMADGNENLVGGPETVRRSVMILLVDDGIPDYGHRRNLLDPGWRFAGCYKIGKVGDMPNCWVQCFGK